MPRPRNCAAKIVHIVGGQRESGVCISKLRSYHVRDREPHLGVSDPSVLQLQDIMYFYTHLVLQTQVAISDLSRALFLICHHVVYSREVHHQYDWRDLSYISITADQHYFAKNTKVVSKDTR